MTVSSHARDATDRTPIDRAAGKASSRDIALRLRERGEPRHIDETKPRLYSFLSHALRGLGPVAKPPTLMKHRLRP